MANKPDAACTLLRKTRKLLNETQASYLDIYTKTGLTPNWLTGVATGNIRDPSVNRIQKLYEYLTASQLTV